MLLAKKYQTRTWAALGKTQPGANPTDDFQGVPGKVGDEEAKDLRALRASIGFSSSCVFKTGLNGTVAYCGLLVSKQLAPADRNLVWEQLCTAGYKSKYLRLAPAMYPTCLGM